MEKQLQTSWIEKIDGGVPYLSSIFGISDQAVWKWVNGKVPAERCPGIEKASNGAVRCEDLRPDVDWAYLRNTRKALGKKR